MPSRLFTRLRKSLRTTAPSLDRPQGVILMYHSVADPPIDPWALSVSSPHFTQQLQMLQQHAHPLSLGEYLQRAQSGNIPSRAIVITFDDGYLNNLEYALPLLERYGIPATIFIATGYLGSRHPFWWDQLTRILLQTSALPQTLSLAIDGVSCFWQLRESSDYRPLEQARHASWTYDQQPPTIRHAIYLDLWQRLCVIDRGERQQVLSRLTAWAGLAPDDRTPQHPLSPHEVQRLHRSNLITIGAHTVTHAPLSILPPHTQRNEIRRSKEDLEQLIGAPVDFFAYPHGDFDHITTTIVRETGFVAACCSSPHSVDRELMPFQLPRVQTLDWDASEFKRQLDRWIPPKTVQ